MRCLRRNTRTFWYCLYDGSVDQYDAYGNLMPEPDIRYHDAVQMRANVSAATGQAQTEMFGDLDSYDRVIVTDDLNCPIDEHTVLFLDKEPEYPELPPEEPEEPEYDTAHPIYDYIVKRVAKSLNSVSIAVRKVNVG